MSSEFDCMEDVVEVICNSLRTESHLWQFDGTTIRKDGSDISFYVSPITDPITDTYNGWVNRQVFSKAQGLRIFEAYTEAKKIKATVMQEKILAEMLPRKTTDELAREFIIVDYPSKNDSLDQLYSNSSQAKKLDIFSKIKSFFSRIKFK